MWRTVYYPEGGFGRGWQARPASSEKTPYEIDIASGDVRRADGSYGGSMSARTLPDGYKQIGLTVQRSRPAKEILVHNLVCWVAHGPRPADKTSVDHGNRGRACNHFKNLKWASHAEQMSNRENTGGRKRALQFEPEEGEVVYDFRGSPESEYTGPQLQFTSHGRILRQGLVSQIKIVPGEYPQLGLVGYPDPEMRPCLVHVLVWSAVYGPDAPIPTVIHHRDNEPSNFRPNNLVASNYSHNATAAHDAGSYDHTRSKRQRIFVFDADSGEAVGRYASQTEAARLLGAFQGHISRCILGSSNRTFSGVVDGVPRKMKAAVSADDDDDDDS